MKSARIFSPLVTSWAFLAQVLERGSSCPDALQRISLGFKCTFPTKIRLSAYQRLLSGSEPVRQKAYDLDALLKKGSPQRISISLISALRSAKRCGEASVCARSRGHRVAELFSAVVASGLRLEGI